MELQIVLSHFICSCCQNDQVIHEYSYRGVTVSVSDVSISLKIRFLGSTDTVSSWTTSKATVSTNNNSLNFFNGNSTFQAAKYFTLKCQDQRHFTSENKEQNVHLFHLIYTHPYTDHLLAKLSLHNLPNAFVFFKRAWIVMLSNRSALNKQNHLTFYTQFS